MGNKINCCRICKDDKPVVKKEERLSRDDNQDMNYYNQPMKVKGNNINDNSNNNGLENNLLESSELSYSLKNEIKRNIEKLKQDQEKQKTKHNSKDISNKEDLTYDNSRLKNNNINFFFTNYNNNNYYGNNDDEEDKNEAHINDYENYNKYKNENQSDYYRKYTNSEYSYNLNSMLSDSFDRRIKESDNTSNNTKNKSNNINNSNSINNINDQKFKKLSCDNKISKAVINKTAPQDIKEIINYPYYKTLIINNNKKKSSKNILNNNSQQIILKTPILKLFKTGISYIKSHLEIFFSLTKEKIFIYKSEESFARLDKAIDCIKINQINKIELNRGEEFKGFMTFNIDFNRVTSKKLVRKVAEFCVLNKDAMEEFLSVLFYLMTDGYNYDEDVKFQETSRQMGDEFNIKNYDVYDKINVKGRDNDDDQYMDLCIREIDHNDYKGDINYIKDADIYNNYSDEDINDDEFNANSNRNKNKIPFNLAKKENSNIPNNMNDISNIKNINKDLSEYDNNDGSFNSIKSNSNNKGSNNQIFKL